MSYPAERAFVVQFSDRADLGRDHALGRAEHIESGVRCRFNTLAELAAFMKQVLAPPNVAMTQEYGDSKGDLNDEDV